MLVSLSNSTLGGICVLLTCSFLEFLCSFFYHEVWCLIANKYLYLYLYLYGLVVDGCNSVTWLSNIFDNRFIFRPYDSVETKSWIQQ